MKTILYSCGIFIALFFCYTRALSQKFSVIPGIGVGSTLAKNGYSNQKGRVTANLNAYYNINAQLSFGIEVATAGRLFIVAEQDKFDPVNNAITKDGSNMKSNTALAKVKFHILAKKKGIRPFVEFGFGVNNYHENVFHIPGEEKIKIRRSSLAYQPEIGISIRHLQVSVRYLGGGRTPVFNGVDDSGTSIKYESSRVSPLYLNVSWRFDL
jgi:hypothetical protein